MVPYTREYSRRDIREKKRGGKRVGFIKESEKDGQQAKMITIVALKTNYSKVALEPLENKNTSLIIEICLRINSANSWDGEFRIMKENLLAKFSD